MLNSYLCEQATLLLDAPLTIEKTEILKNAVLNQAIFAGQSLPPISPEMFAAIQDGSCPAVVRTYVKDNITAGTVLKGDYNDLVESGAITDEVLVGAAEKEQQELVINTDSRIQESFDWLSGISATNPQARMTVMGVCISYYFDPTGNRILIPNIVDCDLSPNGVLRAFKVNGVLYKAIYTGQNQFLGYYDDAHFQELAGTTHKVYRQQLSTNPDKWIKTINYIAEDNGLARIVGFLDGNVAVLKNPEFLNEVKTLLGQVPESLFNVVESEGSPYTFRLDLLLSILRKITDSRPLANTLGSIVKNQNVGNDEKVCQVYEFYKSLTDSYKQLGANAYLDLDSRKALITLLSKYYLTAGYSPVGSCDLKANGEDILLQIIRTTPINSPNHDVNEILAHISPLLETLISKIDYGSLVNAITYIEKRDNEAIQLYDKLSPAFVSNNASEVEKYVYLIPDLGVIGSQDLGKVTYDFAYENGKVKVTPQVVEARLSYSNGEPFIEYILVSQTPYYLNPFDLIVFQNKNYLSAIENDLGIKTGQAGIFPAITLAYSQQKQLNKDIILAVNLASIAIGGVGAINAFRAGAMYFATYEAFGVIGAAGTIGVETGAITGEFADIVAYYNACVGAAGLGWLAGQSIPKLGELALRIRSNINALTIKRADGIAFLSRLKALKASPRWSGLNTPLKLKLENLATYLISKGLSADDILQNALWYSRVIKDFASTNPLKSLAIVSTFGLVKPADVVGGVIMAIQNESLIVAAAGTTPRLAMTTEAFTDVYKFSSVPTFKNVLSDVVETIPTTNINKAAFGSIENSSTWQSLGNASVVMRTILTTTHAILVLSTGLGAGYVVHAQPKPSNTCDICPDPARQAICSSLKALHIKAGGTSAYKSIIENRLCKSILGNLTLAEVATQLMAYTPNEVQSFLNSINTTSTIAEHISKHISQLNGDVVRAWKVVYDAKPTSKFKEDFEVLQAVRTINNNSNKLAAFTDNGGTVASFIQKYDQSRCKICGNSGLPSLPELDDILLNTAEVYEKHHTTSNFMGWYNREVFASNISYELEPEGEIRNIPSIGRDGAQHMIKYMAERPFADRTDGIDQNFLPTAPYPNRQFDIKVDAPIRFVEFKSYKTTTSLNTTASAEQLMSYISQISSMAELRYVFNDRKTNLTEAKTKMQSLLQGSKKNEIFEEVWKNTLLKNSLWNPDDYPNGGITKNQANIDFVDWVQNFNTKIYIIVDVN